MEREPVRIGAIIFVPYSPALHGGTDFIEGG